MRFGKVVVVCPASLYGVQSIGVQSIGVQTIGVQTIGVQTIGESRSPLVTCHVHHLELALSVYSRVIDLG